MTTLFQSVTASNDSFSQANGYFDKGRFSEAHRLYERAYTLWPNGRTAYGLAIVHEALGKADRAKHYYADSLRLDSMGLEARVNFGNLLRDTGTPLDALHHHLIACARAPGHNLTVYNLALTHQALKHNVIARWLLESCQRDHPDFTLARSTLARLPADRTPALADFSFTARDKAQFDAAMAHVSAGRPAEALPVFEELAARIPANPLVWVELGNAALALRHAERALEVQARALELEPRMGSAHHNLGAALQEAGRHDDAIGAYHASLSFNPTLAMSWLNLGRAHVELGALLKAWDAFHVAADMPGAPAEALIELAAISRLLRRSDEAIEAMRRLDKLWPDHFTVANNLGAFLLDQNRLDEALDNFEKAARLNPDAAISHMNTGAVYELRGHYDKALGAYRKALELEPHHVSLLERAIHMAQHQCEWDGIEALFARLVAAVRGGDLNGIHPFGLLAIPGISIGDQLAAARRFAQENYANLRKIALPPAVARTNGKIRIGYLSSDLYDHATAWLIAEIIELHDRSKFEVIAYSYGPNYEGPTRTRLKQSFDRFVDIDKTSDEQAANMMRSDGLDILVDLKGYTQGTRSGILAMRPAPVQINYLGFPGTLGADYVDYIIADNVVIPPELAHGYDEKVMRLPHCYQPNDRKRPLPPVPPRSSVGLPKEGFVFCIFNNVYKITPDVFDIWCRLLLATPGSVLWILSSNESANANLVEEAARRGVAAARLIFAPRVGLGDHLARFRAADLFLDAFPCTAHTTASDALWCGVPVLTMMGDSFASRVAGSILTAIGLPELVAKDFADYYDIAQAIASAPGKLQALKKHLDQVRYTTPLFDSRAYARDYEAMLGDILADAAGRELK